MNGDDDDVMLSELRRRVEAISIERDNATLALSKIHAEEDKKRERLRAEIRELRNDRRYLSLRSELEAARVVAREANGRANALEERLREARCHYRALRADHRALQKILAQDKTPMLRRAAIDK